MHTDIRIGTLVRGAEPDVAGYIKQIIPHGFESFQLFFWQTLGGVDLRELAPSVNEALAGSDAVVSSIGVFGNPLGTTPIDEQSLQGWVHRRRDPVVGSFLSTFERFAPCLAHNPLGQPIGLPSIRMSATASR